MRILGAERYVTQDYAHHKNAEDYSGTHLSPISIQNSALVTRVVNHYLPHEDSLNYNDFIANQYRWADGAGGYQCISITGKSIYYPKDELGGNCVELMGYVNGEPYQYRIYHMASVNVKVGDVVGPNTVLGLQGNTGLVLSSKSLSDPTYGTHVHMEVYNKDGANINPRDFAFGNLIIEYKEQSNPVDSTKDQFVVLVEKINLRAEPSRSSTDLGDVYEKENYTILNVTEDEEYTWYQITTELGVTGWVANQKGSAWLEIHPKSEPDPEIPDDSDDSSNPEIPDDSSYILLFTCPKTDTYFVKLQEGEKLYLQKKKS